MARQSKRRGADWIGCIDFGTALSKFAMVKAVDREDIALATIRPLAIAPEAWSAGTECLPPALPFISLQASVSHRGGRCSDWR